MKLLCAGMNKTYRKNITKNQTACDQSTCMANKAGESSYRLRYEFRDPTEKGPIRARCTFVAKRIQRLITLHHPLSIRTQWIHTEVNWTAYWTFSLCSIRVLHVYNKYIHWKWCVRHSGMFGCDRTDKTHHHHTNGEKKERNNNTALHVRTRAIFIVWPHFHQHVSRYTGEIECKICVCC